MYVCDWLHDNSIPSHLPVFQEYHFAIWKNQPCLGIGQVSLAQQYLVIYTGSSSILNLCLKQGSRKAYVSNNKLIASLWYCVLSSCLIMFFHLNSRRSITHSWINGFVADDFISDLIAEHETLKVNLSNLQNFSLLLSQILRHQRLVKWVLNGILSYFDSVPCIPLRCSIILCIISTFYPILWILVLLKLSW